MPYNLSDFDDLAEEKTATAASVDLSGGKIVRDIPESLKNLLGEKGGDSHGGDYSRQDSSIITSLLAQGVSPQDCYATFFNSTRGKHAMSRKNGHFDDYLTRTINKAVGFITKDSHVSVNFGRKRPETAGQDVIVTRTHKVEVETSQWLWPGYIPLGKITIIAGDPGMGKSTISTDLVARISRGTFLPLGKRSVAGTCLIASAEDAAEDTIVPRLIACDALLSRVGLLKEVKIDGEIRYLSLPRDLERLRQAIIKNGARLLVIDPINAFLEKGTDSYKDQDIRMVLAPLESLAEETGCAIVIVAHLNKKEDASALYRVGGSVGFTGAARSVLAVTTTEQGERVLYSLKSNLSKKPSAIVYDVKQVKKKKTGSDTWEGEETINSSKIEWIKRTDLDFSKKVSTDEEKAENSVEEFLEQILLESEVCTDDIFAEAKKAGIMKSQLFRIRISLGIKAVKKHNGKWYWKREKSS